MDEKIQKAAQLIRESKKVVVLTGAGISTESGIPDFRSPETGLWEKIDPMKALSTSVLLNHPEEFYAVGFKILTSMLNAKPNKSHEILAKMEREGYISTLVTQNIDNLHQKAGSQNVLEVHGHIRDGYCLNCHAKLSLEKIKEKVEKKEIPPRCMVCGGIVRPSVIMFGDQLPSSFDQAWNETENADLLMVIGSSLEVGPVNYLAHICKKLIIINLAQTAYDHRAAVCIPEKASKALDKIYQLLKND